MKIILLTSMRTGSTWLCNKIAKEKNLTNLNEYFHDYVSRTELNNRLETCANEDNWIVKIFPLHLHTKRGIDILSRLCENKDVQIKFLFRKDILQQVYSLTCARFSHRYNQLNPAQPMPGWHDKKDFKVPETYRSEVQDIYDDAFHFIVEELKSLATLYKVYLYTNPQVFFLEDLPSSGKYNRHIEIPVTEYKFEMDIEHELRLINLD